MLRPSDRRPAWHRHLQGTGAEFVAAKEPTAPCPGGNGRLYFRLGAAPKNFDDREAYWDFIEYAYDKGTWHGNTTQVDAFCVPLTIELGDKKAGITESRKKLLGEP